MAHYIPKNHHTVEPYLIVDDAAGLMEFCKAAFGATVTSMLDGPDGRVMHAELSIGDSPLMLGQASGSWAALPAMVHLYVPDCEMLYNAALAAGAASVHEVKTMPYGDRSGGVKDKNGITWWISTHVEDVSNEEIKRRMEKK